VSVGVSVAAAAVLLVDWLQRRSALRAGAEAGDAAPAAVPSHVREPVVEPATEVIPAVPAGTSPSDQGAAPGSPPPVATNGRRRRRRSSCVRLRRPALREDRRALVAVSARRSQFGHRT
jgi:hypothetical protein